MHEALGRILVYGDSMFAEEALQAKISALFQAYSIHFKDISFKIEESFLKPFDLILLEYSENCDLLDTIFRFFPACPVVTLIPQESERMLQNAFEYPIHDFIIADPQAHFVDLLLPVVDRALKQKPAYRDREIDTKHHEIQKRSQTDFKQLYSLLRSLTDTVPDMIWAKDLDNKYIFTNAAICNNLLNATSTLEPLNRDMQYFIQRERDKHPNDPDWFTFASDSKDSDAITLQNRKLSHFKEQGNVFGTNLILDVYKAPLFDSSGDLIGTVGSARDITLYEETKERYRKLFEHSPDPVVVHVDGAIIAANQAAQDFIGAEHREDYFGANVFDFIHKDYRQQSIERLKQVVGSERPNKLVEERYVTLDGSVRDVEAISVPISYGNRKAWMATFRDITDRKRSEIFLKQSLREKSALLREIHHRTRNNMQVITAIINIRSRDISDPASKQMMKEVADRITAMSLIHDRLYDSDDLSAINFSSYLGYLATYLKLNYRNVSMHVPINVIGEDIIVSIDQAVPLALVVNEILTNAYKYAFPDQRKGIIEIQLQQEGEHGLKVEVRDNGIGLPLEAFEDSLSTVILTTLVRDQLGGSMDYEIKDGTRFTIHIPDTEIKSRI